MSFTMFFTPAVLLAAVLAAALLVRGVRAGNVVMTGCALGLLALTSLCVSVVMEFITRV